MSTRVILWDIDGTLLPGTHLVAETFAHCLREAYAIEEPLTRISYAGKTDQQIALETLVHHGLDEEAIRGGFAGFQQLYTAQVERHRERLIAQLRPLPGVEVLLAELRQRSVRQSLLTGNLEPTAHIKLDCAGVLEYLDMQIGAYGSDHHDRNCLVPVVQQKYAQRYGAQLDPGDIVVIGDTPLDIACARAGGAHAIAVATGMYSSDQLAEHAPDALFEDLSDAEAVLAALL